MSTTAETSGRDAIARRGYDDDALTAAVAASRSWRAVLRHLGLTATSSAAIRSVRSRADRLGLDASHFTGQRRWTHAQLAEAVANSRSWSQVAAALGLAGGSSTGALKGHAARLGIDAGHLVQRKHAADRQPLRMEADPMHLPRAGSMLAAAWFTLCGYEVSWPLEPCRYDVLVQQPGQCLRVQVKTTRRSACGTWVVSLSSGGRHRDAYDPDDIDHFFVIDPHLNYYLIPIAVVAGRSAIHLATYDAFKLPKPLALVT